jgi:hypothetical protein
MNAIHYIILANLAVLSVFLKLIFGNLSLFFKAIAVHFFSNEYYEPAVLKRWEKRFDTHHKMNLLYACGLILAVGSFLLYIFLIDRRFLDGI